MRRACGVARQLRFSSTRSPPKFTVGSPRSLGLQKAVSKGVATLSEKDEQLIQRGEFYGVAATVQRREEGVNSPELSLSRMHEHLRRNFRVNAENVMTELILRLESGDESLISLMQRSPDRWIPMAIQLCGRPLSSIKMESRREIMRRLWKQIELRGLPISIESINSLLRVRMENNEEWNPWETLKHVEEKLGLVPDKETFQLLLEKFSLSGAIDQCEKMSYEMARRGHSPSDAISHSHLVYAYAIRGHNHKVDSMIENALTKFGSEGEVLSLGSACVAAAAGLRIDRLRELLRRSVGDNKQLRIGMESTFEIIWALSEKTADNGSKHEALMEKILTRSMHPPGFFRYQYREIERHISSDLFRSAILLLQQTTKLKEELKNQDRIAFSEQIGTRMCKAMIRSRIEKEQILEMANRIQTTVPLRSRLIHDELMFAALTLKDCDMDYRFSSFSSLLPVVDPDRERPHLILPMLAICSEVNDRLSLIFRASSIGYKNLENLDSKIMAEYLFKPMYRYQSYLVRQKNGVGKTAMERMAEIIHSFGVSKTSVWWMMHGWWKLVTDGKTESGKSIELRENPHPDVIQEWLRAEYSSLFKDANKDATPRATLSMNKLETAIERGESSSLLSLISSHGWPSEATLASIAPRILEVLLNCRESSANIAKWLTALSREDSCRRERGMEGKSPLESHHLVQVINHRAWETRLPAREIIEMVYELKRLFPLATVNYDSAPMTVHETNKLISNCFIFKEGTSLTMEAVDDITELLRTLMKLEIVSLSPHSENISTYCVLKVLQRFGWNSAVKLWLQFQSSFSFGNGMLILLSHCIQHRTGKENIQFVVHKAHASVPPSRIHSFYAAMLVLNRNKEEAKEYFEKHGSEMEPFDCFLVYKLANMLRYPPMRLEFIPTFPSLCLAHTPLATKTDEARNMLHVCLRYCERNLRHGPLIMEMCDLFAQYGIKADENEMRRVENATKDHQRLVNQWIFSPNGLIQANADDEFIKEDEWRKLLGGMNNQVEKVLTC